MKHTVYISVQGLGPVYISAFLFKNDPFFYKGVSQKFPIHTIHGRKRMKNDHSCTCACAVCSHSVITAQWLLAFCIETQN